MSDGSNIAKKEEGKNRIRMQIPSEPRYIRAVRDMVYRVSLANGFSKEAAFDWRIIVGEAVSNIIVHAYNNRPGFSILIEVILYDYHQEIRFRDYGIQSPIRSGMARDLTDYRENGLGVYLISRLSDYHLYNQNLDRGTELIVKKRL